MGVYKIIPQVFAKNKDLFCLSCKNNSSNCFIPTQSGKCIIQKNYRFMEDNRDKIS